MLTFFFFLTIAEGTDLFGLQCQLKEGVLLPPSAHSHTLSTCPRSLAHTEPSPEARVPQTGRLSFFTCALETVVTRGWVLRGFLGHQGPS